MKLGLNTANPILNGKEMRKINSLRS